jgi:hypothetical protein
MALVCEYMALVCEFTPSNQINQPTLGSHQSTLGVDQPTLGSIVNNPVCIATGLCAGVGVAAAAGVLGGGTASPVPGCVETERHYGRTSASKCRETLKLPCIETGLCAGAGVAAAAGVLGGGTASPVPGRVETERQYGRTIHAGHTIQRSRVVGADTGGSGTTRV